MRQIKWEKVRAKMPASLKRDQISLLNGNIWKRPELLAQLEELSNQEEEQAVKIAEINKPKIFSFVYSDKMGESDYESPHSPSRNNLNTRNLSP